MSDDILARIDDTLAGDNTIDDDWTVSGDAMRSRPATSDDPEFGAPRGFGPIRAMAFVPHVADPTAPTVAELEDGIDLTPYVHVVGQHVYRTDRDGVRWRTRAKQAPRHVRWMLTRMVTWLSGSAHCSTVSTRARQHADADGTHANRCAPSPSRSTST